MKVQFNFFAMAFAGVSFLSSNAHAQTSFIGSTNSTDCESSFKWTNAVKTYGGDPAFVKYCQGQIDYLFSKPSKTATEQSHLSKMTTAKSLAANTNPDGMKSAISGYNSNKNSQQAAATCKDPKNPLAAPTQPINGKCLPGYVDSKSAPSSPQIGQGTVTCKDDASGANINRTGTSCPSGTTMTQKDGKPVDASSNPQNGSTVTDKTTVKDKNNPYVNDTQALANTTYDAANDKAVASTSVFKDVKSLDKSVGSKDFQTKFDAANTDLKNNGYAGTYVKVTDENGKVTGVAYQDANGKEATKAQLRSQARTDSKDANSKGKAAALANEKASIREDNAGVYGGRYGGKSVAQTQVINQGLNMLAATLEQKQSEVVANKNAAEQTALAAKGFTATQADGIQAQINSLKNGAKALGSQGMLTSVKSGFEAYQGIRHLQSRGEVSRAAASVKGANTSEITNGNAKIAESDALRAQNDQLKVQMAATTDPTTLKTLQTQINTNETNAKTLERDGTNLLNQGNAHTKNTTNNFAGEVNAQNQAAMAQALVAGQTALKAKAIYDERAQAKTAADSLAQMAALTAGGGTFAYNPGTGGTTDPGVNPDNNPNIDNQVVTTGPEAGIDTSGDAPINTNAGDGGVMGPTPDKFGANSPNSGAGAGSPLNMQGGATSAANDAKGGEQVAPGKAQAGGQYAAGDNAGVGSRFSGGSKGPAADTSFMDMMKNLLGGEDKGNHAGVQEIADRSVASDQPSVLSRNKNLFQEISKSYQKKSSEGAIVFTGDRS